MTRRTQSEKYAKIRSVLVKQRADIRRELKKMEAEGAQHCQYRQPGMERRQKSLLGLDETIEAMARMVKTLRRLERTKPSK